MHNDINNEELLYTFVRKDLVSFVMGAFKVVSPNDTYIHSWYIELICEYLLNCQHKKLSRLIINIPPRHMKSLIVNVIYPAWLLGHNPAETILTATYSRKLFEKHSLSFLRLLQSPWYKKVFPDTVIDREALEFITTTAGGSRFSTTVAGQLTGTGGNYIIIDDPMNAIAAESQLAREKVIDWYSFSLSTRQNQKDTVMILIAQRLHEEDLPGYLMQQGNWELLKIPAIAEQHESFSINGKTFTRKKDELLSPERFGLDFYESQKKDLGEYGFAGQYQQRPAPVGGGEIKAEWLRYYDGHLNYMDFTRIICVDPANEQKTISDYTVFTVWGLGADQNLYILDYTRDRLNPFQREEELFYLHNKYKIAFPVLYEKYGKDADISYLMQAMNTRNYRFTINPVGGSLKKEDRIRRLIRFFQEGRIWVPRKLIKYTVNGTAVDLIKELIEEIVMFPKNPKHDDMLDSMSRIFDGFANQTLIFPNTNTIDFKQLNKIVI